MSRPADGDGRDAPRGGGFLRRSLIAKITLPTVALVIVTSFASSAVLELMFARTHDRHAAARATRFAAITEDSFDRAMEQRHADIQGLLELFCRASSKTASVLDRERRVRFTCDPAAAGARMLQPAGQTQRIEHGGASWVRHVRPLDGGPRCRSCHGDASPIGYLAVDVPTREADEELAQHRRMSIGAGLLLAGGLSILLVLLQVVAVHRPVKALTQIVERIRGGDLAARAPTARADELGRLAQSLNDMAASIQTAHTELERTHHAELAQSEKLAALGQLTSSIAHEIKNPLAGIMGALTVVAADLPADDPNKPVLAKILAQMERLSGTAVSLLDYARPLRSSVQQADVVELIDRTLFFLERQAAQQRVEIRKRVAADVPLALVDPDLIKQVLLNMLLNAVQAMPQGGTLSIDVRPAEPASVEVVIADEGPGIPREVLDRLFTAFFTTKVGGTGLGLYIARQIVETQRGQIQVTSVPGEGTSFTVRLPAAARPAGEAHATS